jgi:hypothetical protein
VFVVLITFLLFFFLLYVFLRFEDMVVFSIFFDCWCFFNNLDFIGNNYELFFNGSLLNCLIMMMFNMGMLSCIMVVHVVSIAVYVSMGLLRLRGDRGSLGLGCLLGRCWFLRGGSLSRYLFLSRSFSVSFFSRGNRSWSSLGRLLACRCGDSDICGSCWLRCLLLSGAAATGATGTSGVAAFFADFLGASVALAGAAAAACAGGA